MTKAQLKSVLERVSTWPEDRQRELTEIVREIEAEMSDVAYRASGEELRGIDDGLAGDAASEAEIDEAFAGFRPA